MNFFKHFSSVLSRKNEGESQKTCKVLEWALHFRRGVLTHKAHSTVLWEGFQQGIYFDVYHKSSVKSCALLMAVTEGMFQNTRGNQEKTTFVS